jgi:hypothetical protein
VHSQNLENGETKVHGPYSVTVSGFPGVPVAITSLRVEGSALRLTWAGGAGQFLLERSLSLGEDAQWVEVPLGSPEDTSALVPMDGRTGFFRVFRVE